MEETQRRKQTKANHKQGIFVRTNEGTMNNEKE